MSVVRRSVPKKFADYLYSQRHAAVHLRLSQLHGHSGIYRFQPKGELLGNSSRLCALTSDFKLTRWGESGVYGFLGHLDAQDTASLLMDSIATEARQQMIFRQFEGLFPMPVRRLAISCRF